MKEDYRVTEGAASRSRRFKIDRGREDRRFPEELPANAMQTGQRERRRKRRSRRLRRYNYNYILDWISWVKMCGDIGRKWTSFVFSFVRPPRLGGRAFLEREGEGDPPRHRPWNYEGI